MLILQKKKQKKKTSLSGNTISFGVHKQLPREPQMVNRLPINNSKQNVWWGRGGGGDVEGRGSSNEISAPFDIYWK